MSELDVFEARFAAAYGRYLDEAPTEVDAVAVARAVASEGRQAGTWTWPWSLRLVPVLGWLVLLALLLAALAAALFMGSQRPTLLSVPLVPSGIDLLTPETGSYARMVADGNGILWAREEGGRLVRFDPTAGSARSWTVSHDAAFAASDIAPAREGGVWLVEGHTLRWFDGAKFREVIDAPAEIAVAVEAPDATLWAATVDADVLHWDGSSWSRLDPGRRAADAMISAIAVDTSGRAWIGWAQNGPFPRSGWVMLYDGSSWRTFDLDDGAPLRAVWSIAQLRGGGIWVATEGGLARFTGSSWTNESPESPASYATTSVAPDPDGAIWVAEGDTEAGAIRVSRFDGRTWVSYDASDGLPEAAGYFTSWVISTSEGPYLGTGDGIFRFSGGRWARAWPPASAPSYLTTLLAVSHDELWAGGASGLWHFKDGTWTDEPIDPDRPTNAPKVLALAPDGTLWAAGPDGVAFRKDGRWTLADAEAASTIAVADSGTVWVAGTATWRGTAGPELWTLRFDGTAWVKRAIEGCPLESLGMPAQSLSIDETGALWVGIHRGYEPGGLARFDGSSWRTIDQLAGSKIDGAKVLGTTRGGGVWIAATYPAAPDTADTSRAGTVPPRAARFEGQAWKIVELPDDYVIGPSLAPDGSLWSSTRHGPARYDGERWTYPYASISSSWQGVDAVAPDGTVFGSIGGSLVRYPPRVPSR